MIKTEALKQKKDKLLNIDELTEILGISVTLAGVKIIFPELSDNGNSIPISFTVNPPLGRSINQIEIIAPGNPYPKLLKINPGVHYLAYQFATRIRLATAQNVWVIAKLDNDQVIGAFAPTVLTSSSCWDGT